MFILIDLDTVTYGIQLSSYNSLFISLGLIGRTVLYSQLIGGVLIFLPLCVKVMWCNISFDNPHRFSWEIWQKVMICKHLLIHHSNCPCNQPRTDFSWWVICRHHVKFGQTYTLYYFCWKHYFVVTMSIFSLIMILDLSSDLGTLGEVSWVKNDVLYLCNCNHILVLVMIKYSITLFSDYITIAQYGIIFKMVLYTELLSCRFDIACFGIQWNLELYPQSFHFYNDVYLVKSSTVACLMSLMNFSGKVSLTENDPDMGDSAKPYQSVSV